MDDRDPADYAYYDHPLTDAVKNNSLEGVEAWLAENPGEVKNVHLGALMFAVQDEARAPIFQRLLQVPGTYDFQSGNVLKTASESGCVSFVQQLMAIPAVRESSAPGQCLISAVSMGNLEMVNCLLENNADVNYFTDSWDAASPLNAAIDADNFQSDIFQRLLQCEALNADSVTRAAKRAIIKRRAEVVEQLLAHPLCRAADPELHAVRASYRGNFELAKRFIELGVPASYDDQEVLVQAVRAQNQEMIDWLLAQPGVAANQYVFKAAVEVDNFEFFKSQFELHGMQFINEDIFVSAFSNSPRILALLVNSPVAELGFTRIVTEACDSYVGFRIEIVEKCREFGFDANPLIYSIARDRFESGDDSRTCTLVNEFPEVDWSVDNNYLVRAALRQRHEALVKLLVQCPGVDATANDSEELINYFEQCLNADEFAQWYHFAKYLEMGISFRGRDDYMLRTLASTGKGYHLFDKILQQGNIPKEFLNELMQVAKANNHEMAQVALRNAGADV